MVRRLRAARPNLTLSSDFIVGFPGETEEDFEKTMKLIEDVGFDTSFSFVYSRRPGTPAADLSDDTPQDVKLRWLQRLQALINEQAAAIARGMIGTRQRLLVEGPSRRDPNEPHGPHREQPHRQLRRTRAAHRPDGRRHHHRRAHQFAARPGRRRGPRRPRDRMTQARSRARRSMPTVVNLDGDNTHLANLCGPWTKTCGSWPTA